MQRRRFSREFKVEAVRLVRERGNLPCACAQSMAFTLLDRPLRLRLKSIHGDRDLPARRQPKYRVPFTTRAQLCRHTPLSPLKSYPG
jgi:transposase-like protein